MAIENTVSSDFLSTLINSNNIFDCHLFGVVVIVLRTFVVSSLANLVHLILHRSSLKCELNDFVSFK